MTHDDLVAIEAKAYANLTGQQLEDVKSLVFEIRKLIKIVESGSEINHSLPMGKIWEHGHVCYETISRYREKK